MAGSEQTTLRPRKNGDYSILHDVKQEINTQANSDVESLGNAFQAPSRWFTPHMLRKSTRSVLAVIACISCVLLLASFHKYERLPIPDWGNQLMQLRPAKLDHVPSLLTPANTSIATPERPKIDLSPLKLFHLEVIDAPSDFDASASISRHIAYGDRLFKEMQLHQSRTAEQAADRYQARHDGRIPSPLLKEWFEYAKSHGSALYDDFEQVEANIGALRHVPAADLRARIIAIDEKEKNSFQGLINITKGVIQVLRGPNGPVKDMIKILSPLNGTTSLPDMLIPVNWHDGPKLLADATDRETSDHRINNVGIQGDLAWRALTRKCPSSSLTNTPASRDRPSIDLCDYTSLWGEPLRHQHAQFSNPMAPIDTAVPVLSWGRMSTQTDLLAPQVCYGNPIYRNWEGKEDNVPFEDRLPSLFWRGSSTGAQPNKKTWMFAHRPRFVGLTSESRKALQQAKESNTDLKDLYSTNALPERVQALPPASINALSRLDPSMFNVSFTNYVYCDHDEEACATMRQAMPLASYTPASTAFSHRYLFDIDGNSMSCRFYRLLETESVVFKQTIWAEWHDDRLIPWVHYVPISMGMEELTLLLDFFENNVEGRKHASRIAKAGVDWAKKALRHEDLTIYYYRLLVELSDALT